MAHILGFYPYASQNVSFTGTSAQSTAVAATTHQVRLVANSDCYISIGSNPTATTSSVFLPSGTVEYFEIRPFEKVAVVQSSAAGSLNVTEMGH